MLQQMTTRCPLEAQWPIGCKYTIGFVILVGIVYNIDIHLSSRRAHTYIHKWEAVEAYSMLDLIQRYIHYATLTIATLVL